MLVNVLFAIRALEIGGAEHRLIELVQRMDPVRFKVSVVTMRPGALDGSLRNCPSISMHCLHKGGSFELSFFWRYAHLIDALKPDVIYSYLWDMNSFTALAAKLARHRPKLVWGIFGAELDFSEKDRFLRTTFRLQKWLEPSASLVTSDSVRGLEFLRKYGYRLARSAVIYGGVDTERYQRHAAYRAEFRQRYGLAPTDVAVGVCGRLAPVKGYPILAQAARRLLARNPRVRFFAIAHGDESIRAKCIAILGDMAPRFVWLGKVNQPEACYSGWDIFCQASIYGEGCITTINEAMACELPCVVSDVGDAGIQVGDTGVSVRPGAPEEICRGLQELMADPDRGARGANARDRIIEQFSLTAMVQNTERTLMHLCGESNDLQ